MGDRVTTIIHAVVIICFLVSLGGTLGGMFGSAWWSEEHVSIITPIKFEHGILRSCETRKDLGVSKKVCKFRDGILKFRYFTENKKLKPDIIFVLLLISSITCLLAFICCLTLFCCHGEIYYWRCGTITTFSFGLVGAISSFAGLIYTELESSDLGWDVDWAAILAWLGATTALFGSLLANVLLCRPYKGRNGGNVNVRPNHPVYVQRYNYENNAYNRE